MTLLKSLFSRPPAATSVPSSSAPDPQPAPAAAKTDDGLAWTALSGTEGVQLEKYIDLPRDDLEPFFGHAPARVLDLGCATGATGQWLKDKFGAWVWGCEPNAWAAQLALERLDHLSTDPSDEWTGEDLALLPTVDTVLLLDVLEHMFNPWAQLQFLARHLRRDAQVIVSLPNAGHLSVLAELAAGTFRYQRQGILDVTHIRFFTLAEMLAMFEQTGFAVEAQGPIHSTPDQVKPAEFPCAVDFGLLILRVVDEQQWEQVNAIQYGFRLKLR